MPPKGSRKNKPSAAAARALKEATVSSTMGSTLSGHEDQLRAAAASLASTVYAGAPSPFNDDYSDFPLKPDHPSRPCWVLPNGFIYLDATHPSYSAAYDFLVAISSPLSRPAHLHTYQLTSYSLYAASAVNFTARLIVDTLERLSKVPLRENLRTFVGRCTERYGKIKLVLKEGRYLVEAHKDDVGMLRELSEDVEIRRTRVFPVRHAQGEGEKGEGEGEGEGGGGGGGEEARENELLEKAGFLVSDAAVEMDRNLRLLDEEDTESEDEVGDEDGPFAKKLKKLDEEDPVKAAAANAAAKAKKNQSVSFEIEQKMLEVVKKRASQLDCPLMEEYDFRSSSPSPLPNFNLRPLTQIRPYQARSLSRMFGEPERGERGREGGGRFDDDI
jgi:DNA excision repair protein ERCC-3